MENGRPNIFSFTDYRAFLSAHYNWRKGLGGFSHRTFSDHAGLKSRSYLRLVLAGKRNLTPDSISKFIRGLELKSSEADAFTALVHFNQASDFESRRHYWEVFLKCQPKSDRTQRVRDTYSYLTRMAYPTLLGILRQSHVAHDTVTLAALTGLSLSETEEALSTLVALGALVKLDEARYRVTSDSFVTSDDVPNVAIQAFHRNMLESAKEKIELPPGEREFQSVLLALSKDEFAYLKRRLREIADEIDERFGGERKNSERIFAVNLNLIPVTPEFIRRDESNSALNAETSLSAHCDERAARQNTVAVTMLEENVP